MEKLSEEEFSLAVEEGQVFAKLNPSQKHQIIAALQKRGHIVGFLGDGINDAPALRIADVGISVENGADVAKESADIILLEKNLLVLKEGVLEGRRVFGNILKYLRMAISSNFGNVFSMVGATFLLPFLPLLPIQIIVQNLLYDLSQTTIPFDRVDDEFLQKPRQWHVKKILHFMLLFGPLSSLFDYITFGVLWFGFLANSLAAQSIFQTGWFIEGLLSQTLIIHIIRTRKVPFVQNRGTWPLCLSTVAICVVGLYLPFSPLGPLLGFVPMSINYFYIVSVILLGYLGLTQVAKIVFIRKFGYD